MSQLVLQSTAFVRAAKRLAKKQPHLAEPLETTLELLAQDAFHPELKTHKLKGELAGRWSCSVGYDLRIVFKFVQHENAEAILLEAIGTHDEVY